jgi:3-hydroxyisobutyrate dehydrogenase-like beta-hydroxyacid dehydrogenase
MSEHTKLGFVGVGVMGRPMARRLIEHGHSLVIYDRNEHALAELSAHRRAGGEQCAGSRR